MALPLFMKDSSEKDGKAEIIFDYVLSWCLRRAQKYCLDEEPRNEKLYNQCRYMLAKLLNIDNWQDVVFESVKTWKEWNYIDICAEIKANISGKERKYALLIENKYYTSVHDNQLKRYKEIFDSYYPNQDFKKEYVLISLASDKNHDKQYIKEADKEDFRFLSIDDLIEWKVDENGKYEYTGSDIFDEFFIRWYTE